MFQATTLRGHQEVRAVGVALGRFGHQEASRLARTLGRCRGWWRGLEVGGGKTSENDRSSWTDLVYFRDYRRVAMRSTGPTSFALMPDRFGSRLVTGLLSLHQLLYFRSPGREPPHPGRVAGQLLPFDRDTKVVNGVAHV